MFRGFREIREVEKNIEDCKLARIAREQQEQQEIVTKEMVYKKLKRITRKNSLEKYTAKELAAYCNCTVEKILDMPMYINASNLDEVYNYINK